MWTAAQRLPSSDFDHRVYVEQGAIRDSVHTILEGLSPNLTAKSDDRRGTFFDLDENKSSHQFSIPLGHLRCDKFLAVCRQKLWWVIPSWGSKSSDVPAETQFLLVKVDCRTKGNYKSEKFALILPLLSASFRTCLESRFHNTLLRVESGSEDVTAKSLENVLFISVGTDPFLLLERGFKAVADRLGTFAHRDAKKIPDSLDAFGWCTWDAFYSGVGGSGIVEGLTSLAAGRTPAKVLIIDDGWQDTTHDTQDDVLSLRTPTPLWRLVTIAARALSSPLALLYTSLKPLWYTFFPEGVRSWLVWSYYASVVSIAPYHSFHVWLWGTLSTTVFRNPLLDFLTRSSHTGDFTKRLRSSNASPRFLSTLPDKNFKSFVTSSVAPATLRRAIEQLSLSLGVLRVSGWSDEGSALNGRLKTDHKLKYVYCWHALLGYWGGVHPDHVVCKQTLQVESQITATSPMQGILKVEPQLKWDPLSLNGIGMPPTAKVDTLYDSMHSYLAGCAVDGVKVDAQAMVTMLGRESGGSMQTASRFIKAMEKSVTKHFNGHCINCMCHPTECLYSYKETSVARASDDFYPRDAPSHTTHIANVAYNSLFIGEIVQPDWDMFQSNHQVAALHAAARAVGGCAVYVSDHPGNHDFNILQRLVLPDGSVLRAELPGRPTRDCLFADVTADGETALKIWNRNRCNGLLGAFNVQGSTWDKVARRNWIHSFSSDALAVQVRPTDVEGMVQLAEQSGIHSNAARWAVLSMHWKTNGTLKEAVRVTLLDSEEALHFKLAKKESSTFTVSALHAGRKPSGRLVHWAAFGLEGMFNPGGAILEEAVVERTVEQEATRWNPFDAELKAKGEGNLLLYSQVEPALVLVDARPSEFYYAEKDRLLRIPMRASSANKKISVQWG